MVLTENEGERKTERMTSSFDRIIYTHTHINTIVDVQAELPSERPLRTLIQTYDKDEWGEWL